jgi:hypothetical protein
VAYDEMTTHRVVEGDEAAGQERTAVGPGRRPEPVVEAEDRQHAAVRTVFDLGDGTVLRRYRHDHDSTPEADAMRFPPSRPTPGPG